MLRRHSRKALIFLMIGGAVFGIGQLLLILFIEVMRWNEIGSNAIQLVVTFGLNYLLNSLLTWRDRKRSWGSLTKFVMARSATLALSFGVYVVLVSFFNVHYLVANFIGVGAAMLVNYVVSETWVFKKLEGLVN